LADPKVVVELDEPSAVALVKLLGRHLSYIEDLNSQECDAERLWLLHLSECLAPGIPSASVRASVEALKEELRGRITSAMFARATACRRLNLPAECRSA
jgi:hypothetical protein